LLQKSGVGLGALQDFFGLLDFSGGGCSLLLQAAEGFKVALGFIARAASFDELGIEGKEFFASATGAEVGLIGLRCFYPSLRTRRLTAQIGIVELQEELSLTDVIAFLYKQTLYCGGDGRVSFEILYGLDLAIGGNEAPDGSALDRGCSDSQRGRAVEKGDGRKCREHTDGDQSACLARGGMPIRIVGCYQPVIFQGAARTTASINLPPRRLRKIAHLPKPLND
jgi:hypothetical protein